jgi:hypothetical protein
LRTNDGAIRLASSQDMCFGQVRGLRAGADQQVPDPWQPRSIGEPGTAAADYQDRHFAHRPLPVAGWFGSP